MVGCIEGVKSIFDAVKSLFYSNSKQHLYTYTKDFLSNRKIPLNGKQSLLTIRLHCTGNNSAKGTGDQGIGESGSRGVGESGNRGIWNQYEIWVTLGTRLFQKEYFLLERGWYPG